MTTDEKLILLVEECGEVVQAATKCLRFGWDRDQPDYGINYKVLSKEVGDLLGVMDALPLDFELIRLFRGMKIRKVEAIKEELGYNE